MSSDGRVHRLAAQSPALLAVVYGHEYEALAVRLRLSRPFNSESLDVGRALARYEPVVRG